MRDKETCFPSANASEISRQLTNKQQEPLTRVPPRQRPGHEGREVAKDIFYSGFFFFRRQLQVLFDGGAEIRHQRSEVRGQCGIRRQVREQHLVRALALHHFQGRRASGGAECLPISGESLLRAASVPPRTPRGHAHAAVNFRDRQANP